jgi:hypothetical protein
LVGWHVLRITQVPELAVVETMDGLEMGHIAIGRLAWRKSAIGVKDKIMGSVAIRKKSDLWIRYSKSALNDDFIICYV